MPLVTRRHRRTDATTSVTQYDHAKKRAAYLADLIERKYRRA